MQLTLAIVHFFLLVVWCTCKKDLRVYSLSHRFHCAPPRMVCRPGSFMKAFFSFYVVASWKTLPHIEWLLLIICSPGNAICMYMGIVSHRPRINVYQISLLHSAQFSGYSYPNGPSNFKKPSAFLFASIT